MTTAPKHKRVLHDGEVPRGPGRWLRAADNAMRKPTSQAGELFWMRSKIALELRTSYTHDGPWEHLRSQCISWRPPVFEMKREYVTCSTFCLGMVAQLDFYSGHAAPSVQALDRYVAVGTDWNQIRPLDRSTLLRTVRCQFCGSDVKRK